MEGGFENRASERGSKRPEPGLCWGQEKSNRIQILIVFLQPSQTLVLLLVLLLMPLLWASEIIGRVQVYVGSTGTSTGTFTGTSTGTIQ